MHKKIDNTPESSFFGRFLRDRVRSKDFYLAGFLLAICCVLFFYLIPYHVEVQHASGMSVKPNFFPYAVTFLLACLSIILLINSAGSSQDVTRGEDKKITGSTLLFILLLFCCYLEILIIGMVPAGILTVFIFVRIFGYRRWVWSLIFSIVFVIILFLFFEKIAHVSVPRGILFEGWY